MKIAETTVDVGYNRLHVQLFVPEEPAEQVVLALHGSVEDGKIFYSRSGKGIAPFLAGNGFEVWVPDLAGKGKSKPEIDRNSLFGQEEAIAIEIPALLQALREKHPDKPIHLLAHSWGGVLASAAWMRNLTGPLASMIFFGTKRYISIHTLRRKVLIDYFWVHRGKQAVRKYGFLPAVELKFGSENETKLFYESINSWILNRAWKDQAVADYFQLQPEFNVRVASVTGKNDYVLGHPTDVALFLNSLPASEKTYWVAGKKTGCHMNYGHINLLKHPHAKTDLFPRVLNWLRNATFDHA